MMSYIYMPCIFCLFHKYNVPTQTLCMFIYLPLPLSSLYRCVYVCMYVCMYVCSPNTNPIFHHYTTGSAFMCVYPSCICHIHSDKVPTHIRNSSMTPQVLLLCACIHVYVIYIVHAFTDSKSKHKYKIPLWHDRFCFFVCAFMYMSYA
jgi:hypothetical protein